MKIYIGLDTVHACIIFSDPPKLCSRKIRSDENIIILIIYLPSAPQNDIVLSLSYIRTDLQLQYVHSTVYSDVWYQRGHERNTVDCSAVQVTYSPAVIQQDQSTLPPNPNSIQNS